MTPDLSLAHIVDPFLRTLNGTDLKRSCRMSDLAGNIELFPKWKELLKIADTWEYGSFHSHEELSSILGVKKGTNYYQLIKRVDQDLLLRGKHFENVPKKGYILIKPDEFVRSSNGQIKKSTRYARSALIISQVAPRDKMDPHVKKKTDEHTLGMSRMVSMMASTVKPLYEIEEQIAKRMLKTETPKVRIQ